MNRLAALFLVLALPAHAEGWSPRSTDTVLDRAAMIAQVVGKTHEFFDGGRSFFSVSGSYSYT